MTGLQATDRLADVVPCARCRRGSLLQIADHCADCIALIGLAEDRSEYDAWRTENHRRVVNGEITGAS